MANNSEEVPYTDGNRYNFHAANLAKPGITEEFAHELMDRVGVLCEKVRKAASFKTSGENFNGVAVEVLTDCHSDFDQAITPTSAEQTSATSAATSTTSTSTMRR